MRKLVVVAVLSGLAVAAVQAPIGGAATRRSHVIASTVTARTLEAPQGQPAVVTGTITGSPASGAIVYKVTAGQNGAQNLALRVFYARGTVKGTGTVTVTPGKGNNPSTVTGSGVITGGTGRYRGATGKFTSNGTIDKDGLIRTTVTGKVRY